MTDKKYEKACESYQEKFEHVPSLTVTIVMTPDDARTAMALGGFNLQDFFQGRESVCIRSNPQMRADLEDAAAFGLHVMLEYLREDHVEAGAPSNDNNRPSGSAKSGE